MPYRLLLSLLFMVFLSGVSVPQATAQRDRGSDNRSRADRYWAGMSRGKGSIDVSRLQRWRHFDDFKKKTGFSSKTMSKTQFLKFMKFREEADAKRNLERAKSSAVRYFEQRDKNKDGQLDRSEMSDTLKNYYVDRFDKNRDGRISRKEAYEYVIAYNTGKLRPSRNRGKDSRKRSTGAERRIIIDEIDPSRPKVFATGKLPEDTPDWYTNTDTDKDGQVALYEWRKSGQSVSRFLELDSNSDGFIAPDEMVRHREREAKQAEESEKRSSKSGRNGRYRR